MPDTILSLQNLTKVYKRSHLGRTRTSIGVEDLNLDIQRGEIYGLVGLNGSGKTTTIKLILGLLFPTRGQVRIYDFAVPHPYAQERIGYLPEVPYFYRNLNPVEVLTLYGSLSKIHPKRLRTRIDDVLRVVKMDHAKHKQMKEFSKGMLQRIGLAQALLHDPEILIMDEPITGLDPLGLRDVRNLLIDLNRQGKTIFLSSHSMAELEKVADRVGILIKGKLVKSLSSQDWKSKKTPLEDLFVNTLEETGEILPS